MKNYTKEELTVILADHLKWYRGEGGSRADLSRADLSRADLSGAYLSRADLSGADLSGADLSGAYLSRADLSRADLSGADLSRADLSGADLSRADLSGAYLSEIQEDVTKVLDAAPNEVLYLLNAIRAGKINGSAYEGSCACLVGTIANARGCSYENVIGIEPDSSRPAERWFMGINTGDTPANNPVSMITEEWVVEWLEKNKPELPRVSGIKVEVMIDGKMFTATVD